MNFFGASTPAPKGLTNPKVPFMAFWTPVGGTGTKLQSSIPDFRLEGLSFFLLLWAGLPPRFFPTLSRSVRVSDRISPNSLGPISGGVLFFSKEDSRNSSLPEVFFSFKKSRPVGFFP